MTPQTIILLSTLVYFGIGGFFASAILAVSCGFTGSRFDPLAVLVFFFWPLFLVLRIPGAIFILGGIAAAGTMTGLAWLLLRSLS